MAVLAGKLEAGREDCAPVAGKSTLNRLELSRERPTKYRKIAHEPAAIEALDSGAKRNEVKRSGFGRPFQARQARLRKAP